MQAGGLMAAGFLRTGAAQAALTDFALVTDLQRRTVELPGPLYHLAPRRVEDSAPTGDVNLAVSQYRPLWHLLPAAGMYPSDPRRRPGLRSQHIVGRSPA